MDTSFIYLDQFGNHINGELIYETTIDERNYALCSLQRDADSYDLCLCKIFENDNTKTFVGLDQSDNINAIKEEFSDLIGEYLW